MLLYLFQMSLIIKKSLLGASDNGVSVAVALEVLEVLSRGREPTKHQVIFLFNGAEEKGMLVKYFASIS